MPAKATMAHVVDLKNLLRGQTHNLSIMTHTGQRSQHDMPECQLVKTKGGPVRSLAVMHFSAARYSKQRPILTLTWLLAILPPNCSNKATTNAGSSSTSHNTGCC